jgi:hypothetical protein
MLRLRLVRGLFRRPLRLILVLGGLRRRMWGAVKGGRKRVAAVPLILARGMALMGLVLAVVRSLSRAWKIWRRRLFILVAIVVVIVHVTALTVDCIENHLIHAHLIILPIYRIGRRWHRVWSVQPLLRHSPGGALP